MLMNRRHLTVLVILGLFIFSCKKSDIIIDKVDAFIGFKKPANFPEPVYDFTLNKITNAGFDLGKSLFYEARLSRNNTISCGSCHIQSSAFTQHGHDVSHGIDDRLGTRNSPPIMNLAWSKAFNWDGGVPHLDLQPIVPITTHEEMDENLPNVFAKLQAMPKYRSMFKAAFGTEEITTANFMKALSQFMLMCVSSNSKYDMIMRNEENASFTEEELEGYNIFKGKCASCHSEPLFTDGSFRNNGLAPSAVNDLGQYTATLNETDKYKFKVPSLRNLRYTAPFMHDGRFLTLNGVLEHYNSEVSNMLNLDPLLNKGAKPGIALSEREKSRLTAFLFTLNDETFINNKLLAEQ